MKLLDYTRKIKFYQQLHKFNLEPAKQNELLALVDKTTMDNLINNKLLFQANYDFNNIWLRILLLSNKKLDNLLELIYLVIILKKVKLSMDKDAENQLLSQLGQAKLNLAFKHINLLKDSAVNDINLTKWINEANFYQSQLLENIYNNFYASINNTSTDLPKQFNLLIISCAKLIAPASINLILNNYFRK